MTFTYKQKQFNLSINDEINYEYNKSSISSL